MPATPAQRTALSTVLVSMPFLSATTPSIQLGLLGALGRERGFPVRTLHAGLDLAAALGPELYEEVAARRWGLLGDWLFSCEAFGDDAPDPDGQLLEEEVDPDSRELFARVRREVVPAYLDGLLMAEPWDDVRVVGFSCTFEQTAASFALARRLKAGWPGIVTVFGGACFDGVMGRELVRAVDVVDVAVQGEADVAFPLLLDVLARRGDPLEAPGVAVRRDGVVMTSAPAAPVPDLDASPVPEYDEYFRRLESLGLSPPSAQRQVSLPFESSRGCWWGARHHCTFCGLNAESLAFRTKSASRVLDELTTLATRHRTFRFEAVDNVLDPRALVDLMPELASRASGLRLFYEVKANLSREQVRVLAAAGVTRVQPGVESLSSRVLRLMRKGVTAGQNVNLLRWAQHYGLEVDWNLLWGFPCETEQDYREQADLVPLLVHLPPPVSASRVWLERFSPMFTGAAVFPLRRREPRRAYRHVYPAGVDLEQVAYFFDHDLEDPLPDSAYQPLTEAVGAWRQAWAGPTPPVLRSWSVPGFLQVYDSRAPEREGTHTFTGRAADIYGACYDRPASAAAVRERLDLGISVDRVQVVLDRFAELGLVLLDEGRALALALPAPSGGPPAEVG